MTSIALICYSIGMIAFSLHSIIVKIFYSLKDTKVPMINSIIDVTLNIILNIILVKVMGHAGLALATSISSIIGIIILLFSLNKKIGYFGQYEILTTSIKSLVAAIIMGLSTIATYKILIKVLDSYILSQIIMLFGSIGVGVIVYTSLIICFKIEEVKLITNIIKRKIKNKIAEEI